MKLSNAKDLNSTRLWSNYKGLQILPVGVAQAGAWKYAHIYEIVTRHFRSSEQARAIKESQARKIV